MKPPRLADYLVPVPPVRPPPPVVGYLADPELRGCFRRRMLGADHNGQTLMLHGSGSEVMSVPIRTLTQVGAVQQPVGIGESPIESAALSLGILLRTAERQWVFVAPNQQQRSEWLRWLAAVTGL
eukprot:Hpha_TRINITY_DN28423_c0_g1::TRINITY_DN28423_c0_g1_i1::g.183923::m.183923